MTKALIEERWKLDWLAIDDLIVKWRNAQQPYMESRARKIAADFDPDFLGTIFVMPIGGGKYHIIDGQHRVGAVRLLFNDGKQRVRCVVTDAKTEAEAAQIFLKLQTRFSPPAIAKFIASVTAGNEIECEIDKAVRTAGYKISSSPGDGNVRAVRALGAVYNIGGSPLVTRSLVAIRSIWGLDASAVDAAIIQGVALLLFEHGDAIKPERLISTISRKYIPKRLLAAAGAQREALRCNIASAIRDVLINAYNSGLSSGRLLTGRAS